MKNTTCRSLFWKVYAGLTGVLLVLMIGFFVFFYDYIGIYEKAQPAFSAENFAVSLSENAWLELYKKSASHSGTLFESEDTIAQAYAQAMQSMPGEISVVQDYSVAGEDSVRFFVQKGNVPIAEITLKNTHSGKYGFDSWEVTYAEVILSHIPLITESYRITVPMESTVYVNGKLLDNSFITESETVYPFAHELEEHLSRVCETYTVTALCSEPEIQCVWKGIECTGVSIDGGVGFLYPESEQKTYTVTAPSTASVYVNGILAGDKYVIGSPEPYSCAPWDAGKAELASESTYVLENLLTIPSVTAEMEGIALEVIANDTEIHIPYPDALFFTESFTVPSGSTVTVNGYKLGDSELISHVSAYPDLYGNAANVPMMDVYMLEDLYYPSTNVLIERNGMELSVSTERSDREVNYTAAYPVIHHAEVETIALEFCKDYFTYTASGYRNTEENLNRVLSYFPTDADLYRRIKKSQESISFVTPVTSQKYHELTLNRMYQLDDLNIVCVIHYEIEQWTYHIERNYTGRLWLAFEYTGGHWMITQMLTDTK